MHLRFSLWTLMALLLHFSATAAEWSYETFTSVSAGELKARILFVTDQQASLLLEDGRRHTVPFADFSAEDQIRFQAWKKENPEFRADLSNTRAPAVEELPKLKEVRSRHITWRFESPVPVGRFVNGDFYVVGPVTIIEIDPAPADGRNGSVKNINPGIARSPFDARVTGKRFSAELQANPPIVLKPGDNLISSVSAPKRRAYQCLFQRERNISPVWSYSILTCLEAPVAPSTFRPGYGDDKQRMYSAATLRWDRLHKLKAVPSTPDIGYWAYMYRQPWLELVGFCFDGAAEYQPQYARESSRAEAIATLLLNLDFSREEKQPLLVNVIQQGIDLWSLVRDGKKEGWPANGGHGNGRKWTIVFAGMLLGDDAMAAPTVTNPEIKFGQDMQTAFGKSWTGAEVVYTGHRGIWKGEPVSESPSQQPYEHLPPSEWAYETFHYPGRAKPTTQYSNELYRRTINGPIWVGPALAGRIMRAEPFYAHDAFFAYVDRWMTEDDAQNREKLMQLLDVEKTAHDFREENRHQGRVSDPFIEEMWKAYRNDLPPAPAAAP